MRNSWMEEAQDGIKIAGININNLRYADGTTFTAESEKGLKSLLVKVKEESEKIGLKLMTNLDSILKNRDITLPAKFLLVMAMFFQ